MTARASRRVLSIIFSTLLLGRAIADTPALDLTDWLSGITEADTQALYADAVEHLIPTDNFTDDLLNPGELTTTSAQPPQEETAPEVRLDTEVLEILGEEPSLTEQRSKDIRQEVASRFNYIAIEGLKKDTRKEITNKYPIPANCLFVDAPKLNPEVKVAMNDTALKRDKGIESKQKQMASAISCLGDIITMQLNSNHKNNELLQKLMDLGRLLCDVQHSDSVTRRNFVLFLLKKDLTEHLASTKPDSYLFGEKLAETLKTAKLINKSGTDLKADYRVSGVKKSKGQSFKNLNRKAPGPSHRQSGPLPRSREPVAPRARAAYQTHTHSSRPWPRQPPPPPPLLPPPGPAPVRRRQ